MIIFNFAGRRLVPATPLRSQVKRNCIKKVPVRGEEDVKLSSPDLLPTLASARDHKPTENGHRISSSIGITPAPGSQDGRSLLLPKNDSGSSFPSLSANQVVDQTLITVCFKR